MQKLKTLFIASLLALGSSVSPAQTVPSGMTYQGRLTDASNAPVADGTGYEIEVRLWSASTGGTLLWGTRYTGVPLKSGAFNLILGSGGTPIPGSAPDLKSAFNNPSVHLGLTTTKSATGAAIPSPTEILPRQQIFSTPYAFRAETAATVQNGGVTSAAVKDGDIQSVDLGVASVLNAHLADNAVTNSKIAANTILGLNIAQYTIPPDRLNQIQALVVDEKPTGTPGGKSTANTWIRRDLNKVAWQFGDSITVSDNAIGLSLGTYLIEAQVPAYHLLRTRSALRRRGNANPVVYSNSLRADYLNSIAVPFSGIVTVTAAVDYFEVWQYSEQTLTANDLGFPSNTPGLPEVYTTVKITRMQ